MAFIRGGAKNAWVHTLMGDFYLRQNAAHVIEGKVQKCFDVANINIRPMYRGVGLIHQYLEWLCTAHNGDYLHIESILNEGFGKSLEYMGWQRRLVGEDFSVFRKKSTFDPTLYDIHVKAVARPFYAGHTHTGKIAEFPDVYIYSSSEAGAWRDALSVLVSLSRASSFNVPPNRDSHDY